MKKSFTLIELVVATAIFSVIIVIGFGSLINIFNLKSKNTASMDVQEAGRMIIESINGEILKADFLDGAIYPLFPQSIYGFAFVDNAENPTAVGANGLYEGSRIKIVRYPSTGKIVKIFDMYNQTTSSLQGNGTCPANNTCYIRMYNSITNRWSRLTPPTVNITRINFKGYQQLTSLPSQQPYADIELGIISKVQSVQKSAMISLSTAMSQIGMGNYFAIGQKSRLYFWSINGTLYDVIASNPLPGATISTTYWNVPSDDSFLVADNRFLYAVERNGSGGTRIYKFDPQTENANWIARNNNLFSGYPGGAVGIGSQLYFWKADGTIIDLHPTESTGLNVVSNISPVGWNTPGNGSYLLTDQRYLYAIEKDGANTAIYKFEPRIKDSSPILSNTNLFAAEVKAAVGVGSRLYLWKEGGGIVDVRPLEASGLQVVDNISTPGWKTPAHNPHLLSDGKFLYVINRAGNDENNSPNAIFKFDPQLTNQNPPTVNSDLFLGKLPGATGIVGWNFE